MTRISPAWLRAPETMRVMAALAPARPLFVGGCVRDALLGREAGDLDIVAAAPPEESLRLAAAAGLATHPTGIAHGVVTVVADGRAFEVASMRRDMATDGRRAVVAYTTDIGEDAARRDFTMNALYADADGRVLDPLAAGLDDLRAGRILFVGAPARRIEEDNLRILRFFRFHATLGITTFDPAGRAACVQGGAGLRRISKERIGAEMMKLLGAPDPLPALIAMEDVLTICLPGAAPPAGLIAAEKRAGEPPDALRRLAALGAEEPRRALRLSRVESARLRNIAAALRADEPAAALGYRFGIEAARDAILIRAARGTPPPPRWREEIARGAAEVPPVSASDLIAAGASPGPALGARLKALEERWIASDFRATKAALLASL